MTSAAAEAIEDELQQEVLRALEETGRPMNTEQIFNICPAANDKASVSRAIRALVDSGRIERREHLGFSLWALPGMPAPKDPMLASASRREFPPAPPRVAVFKPAQAPQPSKVPPAPMLQPPAAEVQPKPADPEPTPSPARAEVAPKPVQRSEPTMSKVSRGSNRDKIIQFLQKTGTPAGTVEISKGTGLNTKQTGQAVWQLHAVGSITRTGKGHSSTYSVLGAKPVAAPAKATTSPKADKGRKPPQRRVNGSSSLLDLANAPRFALWSSGELEIKAADQTMVLSADHLTSMLDFLVDRAPQLQKIFGK